MAHSLKSGKSRKSKPKTSGVKKKLSQPKKLKTKGSRRQVLSGKAAKTRGGITANDLKKNKQGKIVSKKKSELGKKHYKENEALQDWTHAGKLAKKELGDIHHTEYFDKTSRFSKRRRKIYDGLKAGV